MNDNRMTLDTNILIYSVDNDAGEKHKIASDIIDKAMFLDCILTVQALAEFYSAATRKMDIEREEVMHFISLWLEIFPIAGTDGHCLFRALKAVKDENLSFWDAMIWAVAKENGCTILLTEDFQDGRKLDGVLIRNPFSKNFYKDEEMKLLFNKEVVL